MKKPVLVIIAAGLGSRYGGLKQIDKLGPNGEIIMDYSVYDAVLAGFKEVVIVIKKENENLFRDTIGKRIENKINTIYAYQSVDAVPSWFSLPPERQKPWGTAHAVLCAKDAVGDAPFAVINADDFYGRQAFKEIFVFLSSVKEDGGKMSFCMAGYDIKNTLTENGSVSRGICEVDKNGILLSITERTKIEKINDKIMYTEDDGTQTEIPKDSVVSMNCWGFSGAFFDELERHFDDFLKNSCDNILKAEHFLPFFVNDLINENKADVSLLNTPDQWYGVTHAQDKKAVMEKLTEMAELYK